MYETISILVLATCITAWSAFLFQAMLYETGWHRFPRERRTFVCVVSAVVWLVMVLGMIFLVP